MDTWRNVSHVSKLKKKNIGRISGEIRKKREEERKDKKTEQRERKKKGKMGFPFLCKIYENWVVGFRWSKR